MHEFKVQDINSNHRDGKKQDGDGQIHALIRPPSTKSDGEGARREQPPPYMVASMVVFA